MTGYYMDSLRGLTTLKLFDRDREHSRILGEKADILNQNINRFMKINFTSFLVTELMIYGAIAAGLADSALAIAGGTSPSPRGWWSSCWPTAIFLGPAADERFPQRPAGHLCRGEDGGDPG